MIRGDSETITVSCADEYRNKINFAHGDKVYFTVKQSILNEEILIQKIVTEFQDGDAVINIVPDDTKKLAFKGYVYDIQLNRADGSVTTIIPPSSFVIEGEVTYD